MGDYYRGSITFSLRHALSFDEIVKEMYSEFTFSSSFDLEAISKSGDTNVDEGEYYFNYDDATGIIEVCYYEIKNGHFEDLENVFKKYSLAYDTWSESYYDCDQENTKFRPGLNQIKETTYVSFDIEKMYISDVERIIHNQELSASAKIDEIEAMISDIRMEQAEALEDWVKNNPVNEWKELVKKLSILKRVG